MSRIDEQLTEQFYKWELRTRGWQVFGAPVTPEPPFLPFLGHYLPPPKEIDDGLRQTGLSSFVNRLKGTLDPKPPEAEDFAEAEEPEPNWTEPGPLIELSTSLPGNVSPIREASEQFLFNLAECERPVAFEMVATADSIVTAFSATPTDAPLIQHQLSAYVPEASVSASEDELSDLFGEAGYCSVAEFGLASECMFPLALGKTDVLVGLAGALSELQQGEIGMYQVIFEAVRFPWAENMLRAVSDGEGGPFFINRPELFPAAKLKVARPLFAVVIRIAAASSDSGRTEEILREMAAVIQGHCSQRGNTLVPLHNENYPERFHYDDLLARQSRRSGMILNSEELLSFVHLPSAAVQASKLVREGKTSKAAPKSVRAGGLMLGTNAHQGRECGVGLTPEQRVRHTHVIGASGSGKSTLLFNLISQDIQNGEGVAVLDPHGDLIDQILNVIPASRINDVVLVDPSDEEYSVGFNILSARSDLERTLLASDLVSVFERLSTSWGDQMNSVLQNALLAFLESEQGGTLSDLRRFLLDPSFRAKFLQTVSDPEVVYYWQKSFPQLSGNKSIGPVLTRLETFLSPKPIRYMVSQSENRLDFGDIMDTGKIFLAKLPQGLIGRENAYLLGSLLVSKFGQVAMSRQRQAQTARRDFWIYCDEFHHFVTPSMAEILGGARKYRIGLTLAHQELRQLKRDAEVESAVLSNCSTRIVFRVGDADARSLAEGFASFEARDLQNLDTGEAVCRVERSDFDFNLTVPFLGPVEIASETRQTIIAESRKRYAVPRAEIEAELRNKLQAVPLKDAENPDAKVPKGTSARSEAVAPSVESPMPKAASDSKTEIPSPQNLREEKRKSKESSPPADMGRGGVQHQAIQHRLKAVAEGLGFRAIIEKPILDGEGSVDLVLEKAGRSIGCEINVTSTIDYEVGNASKCLKAGFGKIAVICPNTDRLSRLAEAMKGCFVSEQLAKIEFHSPDSFIVSLQQAIVGNATAAPTEPSEVQRRGYKVKRSFVELSEQEAKEREESALRLLANNMKKRP